MVPSSHKGPPLQSTCPQVPTVKPATTRPRVETMQAISKRHRRSFIRSEMAPQTMRPTPPQIRLHSQPTDRHVAGDTNGFDDLRDEKQHPMLAVTMPR